MLPYYMGIKGEEDCGPVGVYDASWAVNKNASEKDKKATLDFIKWMITDNEAKKILSKDMGFSVPFTTFTDDYQPDNPLTEAARAYSNDGKTEVRSFTIPDQQWQDDIASALVEYTQHRQVGQGAKRVRGRLVHRMEQQRGIAGLRAGSAEVRRKELTPSDS